MHDRSHHNGACGSSTANGYRGPPIDGVNAALLESALSGLCVALILTDARGSVVWLNRTAERILDLKAADCVNRPLEDVIKDVQLAALWQKCRDSSENVLADVVLRHPREIALKVNSSRCVNEAGGEIGRALLFCDVTTERVVQIELTQDVAERLLALTSGHMSSPHAAQLTHQEVRVLRMVGQGLGNTAIAEKMFISTATVRSHLKNLYRKLKLKSRSEAVSYAVRNHLV